MSNKFSDSIRFAGKISAVILILSVAVVVVAGCDFVDSLSQYEVKVEITNLTEEEMDQLTVSAGDMTIDEFTYEDNIVKADIGDLRGSNEIKPVLAENDEQDFYPESVSVDVEYDGETINFNAVQEENVIRDLQDNIDDAYPGDILILDNRDFARAEISTPGLTLKSIYDMEDADVDEYSNVAGLEIKADDIKIEELNILEDSNIEISDSKDIEIKNSRITGNNNLTGIIVENSEVTLENNLIQYKINGIEADNSELNLNKETIQENSGTGIILTESSANIFASQIRDNEYGFDLTEESNLYLEDSNINSQEKGIYARESSLEVVETVFSRNDIAIELEDIREFQLQFSEIKNSDDRGIASAGGHLDISDTEFINNNYALDLESLEGVELNENTINNNDYGIKLNDVSSEIQIYDNEISFNKNFGLSLQGVSGELSGNEIKANDTEGLIHKQGGQLLVRNNYIEDNGEDGLQVEEAAVLVELNEISYNDSAGGQFIGGEAVEESRVNENNIIENEPGLKADIDLNGEDVELNAEENWWGSTDTEEIEAMISGPVRYEPFADNELEVGH